MSQVQPDREMLLEALEELPEERWLEVLDFIGYLRWRSVEAEEGPQQDWFWSAEWQAAYREAKEDLAEGQYKDFDDVEKLIADLQQAECGSVLNIDTRAVGSWATWLFS